MTIEKIVLHKQADKRVKQGYPWIYSNEIDTKKTPLSSFSPGQVVRVFNHLGEAIASAYVNPHSLICARIVSFDPKQILNEILIEQRLAVAISLREACFDKPYYRLVFGEGDFLPGLIVDRFDAHIVAQLNTAGMEQQKEAIKHALVNLLNPDSILLKNTSAIRNLEHLPQMVEPLLGHPPEFVELEENQVLFQAPLLEGQKTGWFYDHRLNRALISSFVLDKKVLDVFSYVGAFGIQAAVKGAASVTCVDASDFALKQVKRNAKLNGVDDKVTTICEDAFDALNHLKNENEHFDVIILDPPAFIKKRKDSEAGLQAYIRINTLAMKLLTPSGILLSASCSMHLSRDMMLMMLQKAAQRAGKSLQILAQGHQGFDHPLHPLLPEMDYLKAFVVRVNGSASE
ncbi:MAG: class I SAM-dependent rRNA methyltransferase [Gammaproteobacteria bacterium]|nr:class I SAM-dependent rRNA methyltransferase [Gammaproteobacteria bacterium]